LFPSTVEGIVQDTLPEDHQTPRLRFSLAPEPSRLLRARERIRDYLQQYCSEKRVIDELVLCIEEAATNAIRHSCSDEPIEIRLGFEGEDLVAEVEDKGCGFEVASFDPDREPDLLSTGGRGLFLIARLCDELRLRCDGGLEVSIRKHSVLAEMVEPWSLGGGLVDGSALDARARSNARQQALVEELGEAFTALDWEYRFAYGNKAAFDLYHMKPENVIGRSIWDLFAPVKDLPVGRGIRAAMELGVSSIEEFVSPGIGRWLECRAYPTTTGVSLYLREISERKRIEQERESLFEEQRRSEERLEQVLASMTDGFFIFDRDWRYLYVNDRGAEQSQKARDELVGRVFWDVFPDVVGTEIYRNLTEAAAEGEARHYEVYYAPYDMWVEHRVFPQVESTAVFVRDVTEQKRAERALRENEERIRALFETMHDAFFVYEPVIDEDGRLIDCRYVEVNPAAERYLGKDRDELIGHTSNEVLGGRPSKTALATLARVIETGEPTHLVEFSVRLGRWYESDMYSPAPGQAAMILSDITERKQAEEELKRHAEMFQLSFEAIIVWHLEEGILKWNRGAEELYGYSEPEVLGRVTHELLGTVFPRPWDEIAAAMRGSAGWEGELIHRAKDGRTVVVSARLQLVRGDDGVERVLEMNRDITERRQAEAKLKDDLAALTVMHDLSGTLVKGAEMEPVLQAVMEAAVAIVNAQFGTLQLLEGDSLRIVAHHNHQQSFLDFFAAAENTASVCGEATRRGERVVVEDVEFDPLFVGTPSLDVMRQHGVRAVQSTPLVTRGGRLLGILTTQWAEPHRPDDHDLWRVDLLARQASDLIETARFEESLRESEERMRAGGNDLDGA
jgi:PAS domain S-box-containing protein